MSIQLTTFKVGNIHFAIDILFVREMTKRPHITPVCLTSPMIRGLQNLRGQIVTVIDMGMKLLNSPITADIPYCILLKTSQEMAKSNGSKLLNGYEQVESIGLLIDEVGDLLTIHENQLEGVPASFNELKNDYIQAIYKNDETIYFIIDPKTICKDNL